MLKFAEDAALKAGVRLSKIVERRVNSDAANDVKLQEDVESEIFIRGIRSCWRRKRRGRNFDFPNGALLGG